MWGHYNDKKSASQRAGELERESMIERQMKDKAKGTNRVNN